MHPLDAVYIVQYIKILNDQEETLLIGIFTSLELAEAAVKKLSDQPGFRDNQKIHDDEPYYDDDDEGFHINKRKLDVVHWTEGFNITSRRTGDIVNPMRS